MVRAVRGHSYPCVVLGLSRAHSRVADSMEGFNTLYQQLLDKPRTTPQERLVVARATHRLVRMFTQEASRYTAAAAVVATQAPSAVPQR